MINDHYINLDMPPLCFLCSQWASWQWMFYWCYSTIIQWIATAISLRKLEQIAFRLVLHFSTECVDSTILLPLTVINTNITMVISKNQLLLRDTQIHCDFWACPKCQRTGQCLARGLARDVKLRTVHCGQCLCLHRL